MNTVNLEKENLQATATLLFVDDEANILSSLRRLFRPEGYRILTAESAKEGLKLLQQESIDLIISDMRMPEMDGAEFLEQAATHWPDTIRILLTGYADMESTIAAINKGSIYKYTSKPWEDTDLKLTVQYALERKNLEQERKRLLVLTQKQNNELKDLNANLESKVNERTAELQQTMGMLNTAHESLKKQYITTIKIFSNLVELREGPTAGHSRRVAEQARSLALKINLSVDDAQQILFAGLLHDIGKIGLPDSILNVPFEKLDPIERSKVAKHPLIGEGILMALEPLNEAAKIIRSHHENFNGTGYPDALEGKNIPIGSRIIALVNDYDALQNGSLLPRRLSPEEAREFISKHRGKRYDPELVDTFLASFGVLNEVAVETKGERIQSSALKEGMILAKDIQLSNGVLLLSSGNILDKKLINRLQKLEKSISEEIFIFITNPGV